MPQQFMSLEEDKTPQRQDPEEFSEDGFNDRDLILK
jgi:hypothetical protein